MRIRSEIISATELSSLILAPNQTGFPEHFPKACKGGN